MAFIDALQLDQTAPDLAKECGVREPYRPNLLIDFLALWLHWFF